MPLSSDNWEHQGLHPSTLCFKRSVKTKQSYIYQTQEGCIASTAGQEQVDKQSPLFISWDFNQYQPLLVSNHPSREERGLTQLCQGAKHHYLYHECSHQLMRVVGRLTLPCNEIVGHAGLYTIHRNIWGRHRFNPFSGNCEVPEAIDRLPNYLAAASWKRGALPNMNSCTQSSKPPGWGKVTACLRQWEERGGHQSY